MSGKRYTEESKVTAVKQVVERGQVMVHGTNDRCRRVVVLPKKELISEDLLKALLRLNIELLRFEIDEKTANVTVIECEKV